MHTFVAALALAGAASARVLPRQQPGCCFQLTASGGKSGKLGQLDDGQNRVGGDYSPATYCINNGGITDANGRGCILTPPTAQFQCDEGANPTTGFSISGNGQVQHNGDSQFYACGAAPNEYNVYTKAVEGQADCVKITLNTGGQCSSSGGGSASGSASTPATDVSSAQTGSSTPASTAPASQSIPRYSQSSAYTSQPAAETSQSAVQTSQPAAETSQPAVQTSQPAAETSQPAVQTSQPAAETSQPAVQTSQPAVQTSQPAAETSQPAVQTSQPAAETSQPAVETSQPAAETSKPAEATSQPAVPISQPAASTFGASAPAPYGSGSIVSSGVPASGTSQATAPASYGTSSSAPSASASTVPTSVSTTSGTKPASGSASSSACQTSLSGAYQTPHLIVPISSEQPDQAFGTSYNGQINGTTSTIFNFDIPQDYQGKKCSIVFLFPRKEDLETSDYTFSGNGSLSFAELSGAADQNTCYSNVPDVLSDMGSIAIQPGNSYVVANQDCQAGSTQSIEIGSENNASLNFFEDWNPSPLGLYITSC